MASKAKAKTKAKKNAVPPPVPPFQPIPAVPPPGFTFASYGTQVEMDEGPVSSRTRQSTKATPVFTPIPAFGASVPDPAFSWAFAPPATGTATGNLEAVDQYLDIFHSDIPFGNDDLAFANSASSKAKPGRPRKSLASTLPKNDRLSRPGDDDLAILTLPTGYTDYASSRSSGTSPPHRARDPNSTSPKAAEKTKLADGPGSMTEQEDVQMFMSGEANGLACKCGKPHTANAAEVMRLARSWLTSGRSASPSYVADCPACSRSTCVECGIVDIPPKHKCKKPSHGQEPSAYFITWILLCGLDELIKPDVISSKASAKSTKRKRKGGKTNAAWASGTGYGGGGGDSWSDSSDSLDLATDGMSHDKHKSFEKALSELGKRLPHLLNESHMVPFVMSMLRKSRLQLALARFLENDSLHNVSMNTSVYPPALRLVETLLMHEATQPMVLDARVVESTQEGLLHWTYADIKVMSRLDRERDSCRDVSDTREAIFAALRRINATCEAFETNAGRNSKLASEKSTKEMLKVCKLISGILAQAERVSGTLSRSIDSQHTHEEAPKEDWFRANCLLEVDDGSIHVTEPKSDQSSYYFTTQANDVGKTKPGRMKHLLTEMIMLKTSLPPGIFVRHESSRLDIFKVLIIGPKGTPYENGAFEFDFYCPPNYPDSPPLVQFKQTGGGSESMNPNLYPDGKVCLSLLGTWQGTPWQPGKSTLLQVLLSLQSMVFCDEPYYNEPGWSSYRNDSQSESYNRNLYRATTRVGILQWLDAMEERQATKRKAKAAGTGADLWDDVLMHHFATNTSDIIDTLKYWEEKIVKEKQALEAALQASQQAANSSTSQSANGAAAPPIFPPPQADQFAHYQVGKSVLGDMIPRVEKALQSVQERAAAAGIIPSSSTADGQPQHAIKSPAELTKKEAQTAEEEDDAEEGPMRTRSKRRKTGGKA